MKYRIRVLAGEVDSRAGSHVYDRELVTRLAARGHDLTLVCRRAMPEVLAVADVYEIPWSRPQSCLSWRFASLIEHRHCWRRMRELKLPPADLVIGTEHLFLQPHRRQFPNTPWLYFPHAFLMDQEIRSYGLPPFMEWISRRLFNRLQLWALGNADRTVRFTYQGCRVLTDFYDPAVRPQFVVNRVGVDLPACNRLPRGPDTRLLFVGRLVQSKNLDFALRVLATLKEFRWHFDIVGDGDRRESLEALAVELGLGDRVTFHGQQNHPGEWYARANLFVFPSRLESCGIVLYEAMSYGVPSLATRADGVKYFNVFDEIIEPERTGLLADDEGDFRCQLRRALQRPEILEPLGRAAREHVARNNSWDRHIDRYEEVFEDILASPGSTPSAADRVGGVSFPASPATPAKPDHRLYSRRQIEDTCPRS